MNEPIMPCTRKNSTSRSLFYSTKSLKMKCIDYVFNILIININISVYAIKDFFYSHIHSSNKSIMLFKRVFLNSFLRNLKCLTKDSVPII